MATTTPRTATPLQQQQQQHHGPEKSSVATYELPGYQEDDTYLEREYPSSVSSPFPHSPFSRKASPPAHSTAYVRELEEQRSMDKERRNEIQVMVSPPPTYPFSPDSSSGRELSQPRAYPQQQQQPQPQQQAQQHQQQWEQQQQHQQQHLDHPLPPELSFLPTVIPQLRPAFPIVVESPFARAYPPALADRGITRDRFLGFIDGLNEAFVANALLNVGFNVGNMIGMYYGLHGEASLVGLMLTNGCGAGMYGISILRTRAYLKEANKSVFHPVGLHATVLNTKRMCQMIRYPEAKVKLLPKIWREDDRGSPSSTPGALSPSPMPSPMVVSPPLSQHGGQQQQQQQQQYSGNTQFPFSQTRSQPDLHGGAASSHFSPSRSASPSPSFSSTKKLHDPRGYSSPPLPQQYSSRSRPSSASSRYEDAAFATSLTNERAFQGAYHQTDPWQQQQQQQPLHPTTSLPAHLTEKPLPLSPQLQHLHPTPTASTTAPTAAAAPEHAMSRRMEALDGYAQRLDFAPTAPDIAAEKNLVKRMNEWSAGKTAARHERKIMRQRQKGDGALADAVDRADEVRDDMAKKLARIEADLAKARRKAAKKTRDGGVLSGDISSGISSIGNMVGIGGGGDNGNKERKAREELEREERRLRQEAEKVVAEAEIKIEKELGKGKKKLEKIEKEEQKNAGKVMWLTVSLWTAEQREEAAKKEREREEKRRRREERKMNKKGGEREVEEEEESEDDDFDAVIA